MKIYKIQPQNYIDTKIDAIKFKAKNLSTKVFIYVLRECGWINHKYEVIVGIRKPFVLKRIY